MGVPYVLQSNHRNCFLPSCMAYGIHALQENMEISKTCGVCVGFDCCCFYCFVHLLVFSSDQNCREEIAVCRKLGCFIALSLIKRGSFKNALKINLKYIFPQRLISRQGTLCKLFLWCISTGYSGFDYFSDLYLKQWSL